MNLITCFIFSTFSFIVSFTFGIFMSTGTAIDGFSLKMTKLVLIDFFNDIYQLYKGPLKFIRRIKTDVHEAYKIDC